MLKSDEHDLALCIDLLTKAAIEMMLGNEQAANEWLRSPLDILNGKTPISHAQTAQGYQDVEVLIQRIRHGVLT
jgi:uncharacterized protein (DUF2384 family)